MKLSYNKFCRFIECRYKKGCLDEKCQNFLSENFQFFVVEIFKIFD